MQGNNKNKFSLANLVSIGIFVCFIINPLLGFVSLVVAIIFALKNKKLIISNLSKYKEMASSLEGGNNVNQSLKSVSDINLEMQDVATFPATQTSFLPILAKKVRLEKRKKYLHIALNSTLEEAKNIIFLLPSSDRIIIEAGTPLIKIYGTEAISRIRDVAPLGAYIVADNKCCDLAEREVKMMADAGANGATCLGVSPIKTIDIFIDECKKNGIDSMIDMMNVTSPISVLKQLKISPDVVILHRGVDEGEFSKEKQIPYYQIKQIKGSYNILVAVAGGDTIKEIQSAIFNDADIVVVWKNFYQADSDTAQLARDFLKEI